MAGLTLGHTDAQRDELEVPRPAAQVIASGGRRGETRGEDDVEVFHDRRNDAELRRNREMERRASDRIRDTELIVLLGEVTARADTEIESAAKRRSRVIAADSHDGTEQQLPTLLSRHRAGRERRRAARLVEEILQPKAHTDGCLRLVSPLSFPVRAEPTRVR